MKKLKKSVAILLSAVCAVGICMQFPACSKEKYTVTEEEFLAAFARENLSNATVAMTEIHKTDGVKKAYYYGAGDSYALCRYDGDTMYYGLYYGEESDGAFCYFYGTENAGDLKDNNAVWSTQESASAYKYIGVNFVFHFPIEFSLLSYDKKEKAYTYTTVKYGVEMECAYYFVNKKLTKRTILEGDYMQFTCTYEDYGSTVIPAEIKGVRG